MFSLFRSNIKVVVCSRDGEYFKFFFYKVVPHEKVTSNGLKMYILNDANLEREPQSHFFLFCFVLAP